MYISCMMHKLTQFIINKRQFGSTKSKIFHCSNRSYVKKYIFKWNTNIKTKLCTTTFWIGPTFLGCYIGIMKKIIDVSFLR